MEKDDEVKGTGNHYTTFFRQYDPRLGVWFSTDPVVHPWMSSYAAFNLNPIKFSDPRGNTAQCDNCPEGSEYEFFRNHEGNWSYNGDGTASPVPGNEGSGEGSDPNNQNNQSWLPPILNNDASGGIYWTQKDAPAGIDKPIRATGGDPAERDADNMPSTTFGGGGKGTRMGKYKNSGNKVAPYKDGASSSSDFFSNLKNWLDFSSFFDDDESAGDSDDDTHPPLKQPDEKDLTNNIENQQDKPDTTFHWSIKDQNRSGSISNKSDTNRSNKTMLKLIRASLKKPMHIVDVDSMTIE